jgi:hypothetical protein
MREAGVACGENRAAKLMRLAQIKSVRGYKLPKFKVGKPALVAPNQLQRQFQHNEPIRRHKNLDQLSPLEFERKSQTALLNVSRKLGNAILLTCSTATLRQHYSSKLPVQLLFGFTV